MYLWWWSGRDWSPKLFLGGKCSICGKKMRWCDVIIKNLKKFVVWSHAGVMHERVGWRVFVKVVGAYRANFFSRRRWGEEKWSEAEERREWPFLATTAVHVLSHVVTMLDNLKQVGWTTPVRGTVLWFRRSNSWAHCDGLFKKHGLL